VSPQLYYNLDQTLLFANNINILEIFLFKKRRQEQFLREIWQ